jgi:hypothetical protein
VFPAGKIPDLFQQVFVDGDGGSSHSVKLYKNAS